MRKFLSGVAIVALLATPAIAEQGKGQGGGNDKPDKELSSRGQGGGKPDKPGKPDKAERGAERRIAAQVDTRGNGKPDKPGKPDRAIERAAERAAERADRVRDDVVRGADRVVRVRDIDDDDDLVEVVDRGPRFGNGRGLIDGCPPGLAKKNNGCLPPGQAKKTDPWLRADWLGLRGLDGDDFLYHDGYLLRLGDDDRVLSYVPLLGGALALGNPWPQAFQPVALPPYYQDFFDLGPVDGYRYFDNTVFRVDPETAAITAVAALLTGEDITVGQPMPLGYDVYNVPLAFRQQYVDGPNALYRYSDGYIYQLDPETRLVQAAIELLL